METERDNSLQEAWPSVWKMVERGWIFSQHIGFIKANQGTADLTENCNIAEQKEVAAAILRLADRVEATPHSSNWKKFG